MSGGTPTWATAGGGGSGIVTAQRISAAGNQVVTTTSIPSSGVRRIIILFDSLSTNGPDFFLGLRTALGGYPVEGDYYGTTSTVSSSVSWNTNTYVRISPNDNSTAWGGSVYFEAADSATGINIWSITGIFGNSQGANMRTTAGFVDMPNAQVIGASVFSSGVFDNGGITFAYELGSG
jgi:hypothetical protein